MQSMKLTKAEAKSEGMCAPSDDHLPRYPYGLELSLSNETLEKLGIEDMPDVGYVMKLTAFVTVTRVSQSQSQDSKQDKSLSLQITDMEFDTPMRSTADIAKSLWPA